MTQNIIVGDSVHNVFEHWAHVENFPRFMKGLMSVEKTGDQMVRWEMKGDGGTAVAFTTETTRLEKDQRIAWHTPTGDIKTSGQITFTPLPHNETEITVTLHVVDGEDDAAKTTKALRLDPGAQLTQVLRNFKAYVEEMPERIH